MNIKEVIENVVQLFGDHEPHTWQIRANKGAGVREQQVMLPKDPVKKKAAIEKHVAGFAKQAKSWFPEHDGPTQMMPEPVNHLHATTWLDHEDPDKNMEIQHRFIPNKG